MATYTFESVQGTPIAFDPAADTLHFLGGSAAQLRFAQAGAHLLVSLGGLWVVLVDTTYGELGTGDLTFADGSLFLIGGAGNDTLTGNTGDDLLDGHGGADVLAGGAGADTYVLRSGAQTIVEASGEGIDLVRAFVSHALGANVEQLWLRGAGNINGYGNALDNTIHAGDGDNVMNGGSGNDTVSYLHAAGGVSVDLALATAQATGASGTDTIVNFDNLVGSHFDDVLRGNSARNFLNGVAGDDILDGGGDADLMVGGAGNDLYRVDHAFDRTIEVDPSISGGIDRVETTASLTMAAGIDEARVLGFATVSIVGNALDNIIYAGHGNQTLDGGAGVDTLSFEFVEAESTGVSNLDQYGDIYNETGTTHQVYSGFEHVIGSAGRDNIHGNAGDNRLEGRDGNDTMAGGLGTDTLIGGLGDDLYYVFEYPGYPDPDDADDVFIELAGQGFDEVRCYMADYTLPAYIEMLHLNHDGDMTVTGNAEDNLFLDYYMVDNASIDGGAGDDLFSYRVAAGSTALDVDLALGTGINGTFVDTFVSIEGVEGAYGNDILRGDGEANRLLGWVGNDTLVGRAGDDTLTGEAGSDVFVFDSLGAQDTITDFTSLGDLIDVSLIDADAVTAGDQAFTFIGSAAFGTDATAQLRYDGGVLYGSTDADAAAEFTIVLTGAPGVVAEDFVL